jgi:hypothetical protein
MGLSKELSSGLPMGLSSESPPGPPHELSSGLPHGLPSEQPLGRYRDCLTLGGGVKIRIRVQSESGTMATPLEWRLGSRCFYVLVGSYVSWFGRLLPAGHFRPVISTLPFSLGHHRATAGDWRSFREAEPALRHVNSRDSSLGVPLIRSSEQDDLRALLFLKPIGGKSYDCEVTSRRSRATGVISAVPCGCPFGRLHF